MYKRVATAALALFALSGSILVGCKEDPPPPPMPEPKGSVKARGKPALRSPKMSSARLPDISDETMKRYRLELCRYGSYGLKFASDAYLGSLAGAAPSKDKIPTFGDHPDSSGKPKLNGRAAGRALPFYGQLPFGRHVRACSLAKRLTKPATPELNEALAAFDTFSAPLNRKLMEALRYYGRQQYKKDKFQRAAALHKELIKVFPQIDGQLASLDKAAEAWLSTLKKQSEKLDKAGDLASAALDEARNVVKIAMADVVDEAAFKEAAAKLVKAIEAVEAQANTEMGTATADKGKDKDKDKTKAAAASAKPTAAAKTKPNPRKAASPFARVVPPQLKKLELAVEKAQGAIKDKKLSVAARYGLALRLATALEANHQALGQLLRVQGKTKAGGPLRLMKPRVRANTPRPRVRPRPKVE